MPKKYAFSIDLLKYFFLFFAAYLSFSVFVSTVIDKQLNNILLTNGFEEFLIVFLLGLSFFIIASQSDKRKKVKYLTNNFNVSLLVFLIFCVLHLILGGINKVSFVGFILNVRFIGVVFLGMIIGLLFNDSFSTVKKIIVICGMVSVFVGLIMTLLPSRYLVNLGYSPAGINLVGRPSSEHFVSENLHIKRIQSTFRSPNGFGVFLLMPVAILLFRSVELSRRQKTIALTILIIGIVGSFSRAAWIGLFIVICYYLVYSKLLCLKKPRGIAIIILSVLLILLIGTLAIANPKGRAMLFHQTDGQANGSTNSRINYYKKSISSIINAPLGYGHGSASPAGKIKNNGSGSYIVTENSYLQIGVELGVIGLLLFLNIFITTWVQIKNSKDILQQKMLLSIFYALLFIGLVIPVWTEESVSLTWWLLFSVFMGIKANKQKSHKISSAAK